MELPEFRHLLFEEAAEGIVLVTINRPEALNALNPDVFDDLGKMASYLDEGESSVRCAILTGAGERVFAAGADIAAMKDMDKTAAINFSHKANTQLRALECCRVPIIAAINGLALGGGLEVAMACHFRYAAETAKLGQPEVKLGIIPGAGGTVRLQKLVGPGLAREMILTGEPISATKARQAGLINGIFPASELLVKVSDVAAKIAANPVMAVRFALSALEETGQEAQTDDAIATEVNWFGLAMDTADAKEGLTAFTEKRKPNFTGK